VYQYRTLMYRSAIIYEFNLHSNIKRRSEKFLNFRFKSNYYAQNILQKFWKKPELKNDHLMILN
jgi:hypothetical protein